ncbi:MAG TPA: hypothetical protein VIH38_12265, partial [Steroidobacteraceae bacterium]
MKRLSLLVLAALGAGMTSIAALPATTEAALSPATPIADTATTTRFDVDGIPVILRRNTANEVVVANLYLLGGTRQLTPQTAGIEAMLLIASERGTKRFPGSAQRQRTARLGSTIGIEAGDDWSAIGLHAIRGTFDSTWALMADRVIAPTLDAGEVAIVRDQMVTAARQRGTDPDDAATELADSLLHQNHPYAIPTAGTARSLAAITVPQMRQYHAQQFVTSRMLLVVVGNVDRAQV